MEPITIAIYVSTRCSKEAPGSKQFLDFRTFLDRYWHVLAGFKLLVPEATAAIIRESARKSRQMGTLRPHLEMEVVSNSRVLVNRVVASRRDKIAKVFLFLDPADSEIEIQRLDVLLQAVSQHSQLLWINLGVALQAHQESANQSGAPQRAIIRPDDALVVIDGNTNAAATFLLQHLATASLFPRVILSNKTALFINMILRGPGAAAKTQGANSSVYQVDELLQIAESVSAYWCTDQEQAKTVDGKVCNILVFDNDDDRHPGMTIREFVNACFDPHLRVNLLLNPATAQKWIESFEPVPLAAD